MTVKVKYLILGAGPAGLSLAAALLSRNETSFLVLEREDTAGGLCRSETVDGSALDIGGGHFLDVRRKEVLDFVFQYMPAEDWNLFDRISKIRTQTAEIDYPYESSIWQLPVEEQVQHLASIARAGCNTGEPMPERFSDWIAWKLGEKIAGDYMLPYNRKIFSVDLDTLGTYWLHKLPDVPFEDTLRSCLYRRAFGSLPGHAQFYYPKQHGYGELFLRIADSLGMRLLTGTPVKQVDFIERSINGEIQADVIINTIPWTALKHGRGMPESVTQDIERLKFSSIDVSYFPEHLDTPAHWSYIPDEQISYHRILHRENFLPGSRGYWTETNSLRTGQSVGFSHHNEYAYPLNTLQKPQAIQNVLQWASQNAVIGLGRWGEWEHMNSDVAMSKAIALANTLAG